VPNACNAIGPANLLPRAARRAGAGRALLRRVPGYVRDRRAPPRQENGAARAGGAAMRVRTASTCVARL
jgi:hypothetical protein